MALSLQKISKDGVLYQRTVEIEAATELKRCMVDLEAAVFHLNVDQDSLVTRPSKSDLEAIDFDGVLRRSADRLKDMVDDPAQPSAARQLAEEALIEIYLRVTEVQHQEAI